MSMPGMGELLIILVIVLLVFGANKLPMLGEGIGKAIKNFKRGLNVDEDIDVTPSDKRVAADSSANPWTPTRSATPRSSSARADVSRVTQSKGCLRAAFLRFSAPAFRRAPGSESRRCARSPRRGPADRARACPRA